tara:strand:+ start:9295 stop:10587 length:1293 start_codon:yes stop_codon:yes gene_type:complete
VKPKVNSIFVLILLFLSVPSYSQEFEYSEVLELPDMSLVEEILTGLDVLEELKFFPLYDLSVAVLTHEPAVNRQGIHLLDLLQQYSDSIKVKVVFTPEHGFFTMENVNLLSESKMPYEGMDFVNLWGDRFRPDRGHLRGIDLILMDVQDTGLRFTTTMTTVSKVMEAAAMYDIPVMVLDRPNPLKGSVVEGPIVRPEYQSFVGYHMVPLRHGLTLGEYTLMVNEMEWLRQGLTVELMVIPMANWKREMWFDETNLSWIDPIPGISNIETLLLYEGMSLLEGSNLSFGTGTDYVYEQVGAPWILNTAVYESIRKYDLIGASFSPVSFVPDTNRVFTKEIRFKGFLCSGLHIQVIDRNEFNPLLTGVTLMSIISRQYPREFAWIGDNYVDKLYGHDYLRIFLAQERKPEKIESSWGRDVNQFYEFRKKFLLY